MNEKKKTVLYIILLIILSVITIGLMISSYLGILPIELRPILL